MKLPKTPCKPVAEKRWCRFRNGSVTLHSGTAASLWWHPQDP